METTKTAVITDPSEKTAAALGAFMFFIPYFMDKRTEFTTLYMRQNFGIWIVYIIFNILLKIIVNVAFMGSGAIVAATETRSGGMLVMIMNILMIAFTLIGLGLFILSIYLIYKAYKGERYEFQPILKYTNLLISKIPALQNFFSPKTKN